MILHDKLTCVYSVWHFSISSTQTRIEEDEPKAATREVTVEHTGIEVLKIDKNLLVIIRDEADSSHKDVCDGVIATEYPTRLIGYFELKSTCTKANVLKARKQILDSQHHLYTAFGRCETDCTSFTEKGIIVTQPITDEERLKNRKRLQRDNDRNLQMSAARFLHRLLNGKVVKTETGITLMHFNADAIIPVSIFQIA